ncbi:T6SS effector BTH_I2691 family protein [Burkholderia cepacia]|uniref:T6SS effector BTH_I2691 family protein n=1 Tax=Burkholderia cepacia TaxID=292 RepID=UPI002AB6540E|nr:T6SS effector BTH_I2691 family protein [Burkholderia cepacia]
MSQPTYSLTDLLGISRDAANRTRSNEAPSPCVSCKRTLTILPLRYGVIADDDKAGVEQLASSLPAHLGKKLNVKLSDSRYAVRSVREGYIYLFVQRRGKTYACEATYRVCDSGLLQPVWSYDPGVPVGGIENLGSWTLSVGDPEDIDEARILFTPDPLSPAKVDRYRDVALYRNRLQKFDLRTLARTCTNVEDVVDPHQLDATVAELRAGNHVRAKAVLERQAFPPFRSALKPGSAAEEVTAIYKSTRDTLKSAGVAVVLYDPIGVVQELNAWRNDAIEINRAWLQVADSQGITNERRHAVAEALDNIKEAMQRGYIESAGMDAQAKLRYARDSDLRMKARFGFNPQNLEELEKRYDPAEARQRAEKDAQHAFDRYQVLLDWDGAKASVQKEFSRRDKQAQQEMDKREPDHLDWLHSELLAEALDLYDRRDPVWGQAFAEQVVLCVVGMNGCASGAAKLGSWWSDIAIGKGNFAWRALTRNQVEIEEAAKLALAEAKAQAGDGMTLANMTAMLSAQNERFKNVADLLGKADAAVDAAMVAGTHRWFDAARLSRSLTLFAQAHQYLFKLLPHNAADRNLLVPMLGFIHANLGRSVTRLRLEELAAAGRSASEARVAGQVNAHIARVRNTLTQEFQNRGNGQFYKVRAGVIVALVESIALLTKAAGSDKGTKEYAELTAAGLVTAAAGFELAATGIESVAARYAPSTVLGRGASIALGGMKLFGGLLATVGGGISAAIALVDAAGAFREDRRVLGYAYLGQAMLSTAITALASVLSLSASGPYLRWLLQNTERTLLRLILPPLIRWSAALAVPEVTAMLGLALGWATAIGVVVAVVIWAILPDELESWCTHSCLGKRDPSSFWKPFKSEEKELVSLYEAFGALK